MEVREGGARVPRSGGRAGKGEEGLLGADGGCSVSFATMVFEEPGPTDREKEGGRAADVQIAEQAFGVNCWWMCAPSRSGSLNWTIGGRSEPMVVTAKAPEVGMYWNEEMVDVVRPISSQG